MAQIVRVSQISFVNSAYENDLWFRNQMQEFDWITVISFVGTCNSKTSIKLSKKRTMRVNFNYYEQQKLTNHWYK